MKNGKKKHIKNILYGFILMDRDALPLHMASSCFLSIGIICFAATISQVLDICNISFFSSLDFVDHFIELTKFPKEYSFVGILLFIVLLSIFFSLVLIKYEKRHKSLLNRIPKEVSNKLVIKSLLFNFFLVLSMIISGFISLFIRY